jgi:AcrR family transcriptional regulator
MDHDQTSRALLEAAHRLLADHGLEALTVRRIATEAGMSTMNVYSRFGGKDGVIDELFIDGFGRLFAAIYAVPETEDVGADLKFMFEAYRRFAKENATYYQIMFRSSFDNFEPSQRATDLALAGLEQLIQRIVNGQRLGRIRSDDGYTALEIAAWLWASCHGLVSLELSQIGEERVDWGSVFEHGLRASLDVLHPSMAADR